ncbi:MAG TPA: hypothetical protein PKA03_01510 [Tabrizicola sp.]|nr:hypothetical protein [Tabrizicola sp.]
MKKVANKPDNAADADLIGAGLKLQEDSLRLLLAEVKALQSMLALGEREIPTDAETEAGYDNMPV